MIVALRDKTGWVALLMEMYSGREEHTGSFFFLFYFYYFKINCGVTSYTGINN